MEKIIIKNFGPIEDAEIEIRKVLVLIGEQASGKSTIAKLVYFFKTIGLELFENFLDAEKPSPDIREIIHLIRRRFYLFFGSTKHFARFDIQYEYAKGLSLAISNSGANNTLELAFSPSLKGKLINDLIARTKRELMDLRGDLLASRSTFGAKALKSQIDERTKTLYRLITSPFGQGFDSSLYVPAGRESTVSYPLVFEAYMEGKLSEEIEKLRKSEGQLDGQASDEILMLSFLNEVRKIRSYFSKYGGLDGIRDFYQSTSPLNALSQTDFESFAKRFSSILKGKWGMDDFGEFLTLTGKGEKVYIKDASSGQKESIRILQDAFLSVSQGLKTFRVIEEPEAHLFPIAQKQLIELLVFLANAQPDSQVIITTHSPYVLTAVNNMLVAQKVAKQFPEKEDEIAAIYPQKFRIEGSQFAAYSLGNSMMENAPFCVNLVSEKTGLIAQNYLDTVSLSLGHEFQQMMQFYRNARINHDA
jgi:AAA ATPase domain